MSWVEKFFVENPTLYASTITKSLWIEGERTARVISRILNKRFPDRQLSVLDVPCGVGRVAIPLANLGVNVIGIDISPEYVKLAREKPSKQISKTKQLSLQDTLKNWTGSSMKIIVESNLTPRLAFT